MSLNKEFGYNYLNKALKIWNSWIFWKNPPFFRRISVWFLF